MDITKGLVKKFFIGALAGGLLLGAGVDSAGAAQAGRGNSGLPPGPGNPIAAVYKQVLALDARVDALEAAAPQANLLWINHLGFMADILDGLSASYASAPLAGAGGLLIKATGAVADKGVETGLQVPPGYGVTKVRLCYQVSNSASFITHIKLAQLTTPGATIDVLSDLTDRTSTAATCVDSAAAPTAIDPVNGPLRLNIGVTFANSTDQIVVRAIGLYLEPL